jgi:polyhydroxyalkanoate synthesis regulator phasin
MSEEVLREAIRNLQMNNLARLQEIGKLRAEITRLRARITKLQQIAERKNSECRAELR